MEATLTQRSIINEKVTLIILVAIKKIAFFPAHKQKEIINELLLTRAFREKLTMRKLVALNKIMSYTVSINKPKVRYYNSK